MGTLDLCYDNIKKQVSLSGIHRLDSKHGGLRAVAATVVIFYQDDSAHVYEGSQASHENVPSSLSFIPAPKAVVTGHQQRRSGASDSISHRRSLQHRSNSAGINRVSFNTRHVDGEQDVEERMVTDDCLAPEVAGSQGAYPDSAGYEDVEMTGYEANSAGMNGEDTGLEAGLPVQIKVEPLSPDHISIPDEGDVLPEGDAQSSEVRTLPNSSKKRNQDGAHADGGATSSEGPGSNGFEVQELKQEDDSDLENLPLHFLTEPAPGCSADLDLGESVCGNPYESIMTESVDLTELPGAQADATPEAEPGSVSGQEASAAVLRSSEEMQKLPEDTGSERGAKGNSVQGVGEIEGSASHCGSDVSATGEGAPTSSAPGADFTSGMPEVSDATESQSGQTSFPNVSESEDGLGPSNMAERERYTSLRTNQDATGASCVSEASAPDQVQLIDLQNIKKEPDPDDCCIVGVTPGRRHPPVPSAIRGHGGLPGRGNLNNHMGRLQAARRAPAIDRRSELVHRYSNIPPRVPSRMPARVPSRAPSRAPSRQAMYYGYVVRRELQRHQMGATAPRRRRQRNYNGNKYGSCAVCQADIFNYMDYLEHLDLHRDILEDAASFSCPMCLKKSTSYMEIANSHATTHIDKDLHTCPVCKSHIFRKDNFRRHFTLRHPNDMTVLTRYLSQYKKLVTNRLQRQAVKPPGQQGSGPPPGPGGLGRQGERNPGVGAGPFPQGFPHPVHTSPGQGDGSLMESQMANYMQRQLALSQSLGPPHQSMGARPREGSGAPEMHSPSRPVPQPGGFPPPPPPPPPHSLPASFADMEARYAQTSGLSLNQPTHPITHLVQSVLQHEANSSQVASMPCASGVAFPPGQFPQPGAAMVRNLQQASPASSSQKGAAGGEAPTPTRSRIGRFANMCCFCFEPIPNKIEYGKHLDRHHQRGCDFVCPICQTTLSTRSCCLRHADSHTLTDTDQSQCPECHKNFVRADNFKRHLRIVHNITTQPKRNVKTENS